MYNKICAGYYTAPNSIPSEQAKPSIRLIAFSIFLIFIDLGEHTCNLLLEKGFQVSLCLLVKLMLLAKLEGEFGSGVSFVDNDALLLVGPQINIHKKERGVWVIEVIIFVVLLVAILIFICLVLSILFSLMTEQIRQLGSLRYLAISLNRCNK